MNTELALLLLTLYISENINMTKYVYLTARLVFY